MSEDDFIAAFVNDVVEEAELAAALPLRRQCQYRKDAFSEQRERLFQKNFRLSKGLTQNLMRIIEPVLVKKTEFDLKTKVLCALNFFGHGSYQSPVGENVNMNMSQPSVSRCIAEVTEALNHPEVFEQLVKFPSTFQELNQIVRDFYSMYGLPGVIGCLDCTHCAIVPPDTVNFDERSYVNRKNFHSINTQLICDANLKIINVNALFPGSTHDCHIWNSSRVLTFMEQLYNNGHTNYHLIADSGYALRPWCLTPIQNPEEDTPEQSFNQIFKRARCTIERCNGVLKARFRCLLKDRVLHYTPTKATKIINACSCLHNMCVDANLEEPDFQDLTNEQLGIFDPIPYNENEQQQGRRVLQQLAAGRAKRAQIVANYFN